MKIKLNTIDTVRDFVSYVTTLEEDIDLTHDRYVIDAKSIMGIFSLDLSEPINLIVHAETKERETEIMANLKKFEV